MRQMAFLLLLGTITACTFSTFSGHQRFYQSFADARTVPGASLLKPGERPSIVYGTQDPERDVKLLISKGYVALGMSGFNGPLEKENRVIDQAARAGATLILLKTDYTHTQTNTVPVAIPDNSTTYGSGSLYGPSGSAYYNTSSTTYHTAVIPVTTQQQRYDQLAIYFVWVKPDARFGLLFSDLTPALRQSIQRNTGAFIDNVLEDSPAFIANVLPGDILIRIDATDVRNAEHARALAKAATPSDGISILTCPSARAPPSLRGMGLTAWC